MQNIELHVTGLPEVAVCDRPHLLPFMLFQSFCFRRYFVLQLGSVQSTGRHIIQTQYHLLQVVIAPAPPFVHFLFGGGREGEG